MKHLYYVFCFFLLLLCSCGRDKASWHETEQGVKFWAPSTSLFDRYVWVGDTINGVINGSGTLRKVDRNGKIEKESWIESTYGLVSDKDVEHLENGWLYWGIIDDNIPDGMGVLYRNKDQSYVIGTFDDGESENVKMYVFNRLIYQGGWDDFEYDGDGVLYYEDGNIKYKGCFDDGLYDGDGVLCYEDGSILYEGSFKEGKYHGYGILHLSDSSEVCHVWQNGDVNPIFKPIYSSLEDNRSAMSNAEYVSFKNHLISYEHYRVLWKLLIIIGYIVFILSFVFIYKVVSDTDYLYGRSNPLSKTRLYLVWLFFGLFGIHRILLKSKVGFVNMGMIFIALICNLTPLTMFAHHYRLIPLMIGVVPTFYVAVVCVCVCVVLWLFDSVWVAYRIYFLTSVYYRHDKRELDILQNRETDVDALMLELSRELPILLKKVHKSISSSVKKSKENINHSTHIGRWLKWGEKDLQKSKYEHINNQAEIIKDCQTRLSEYSDRLSLYLKEARVSAYRNLYLAKEIISCSKNKVSSKKQSVHKDIKIQVSEVKVSKLKNEDINFNIDYNNSLMTFERCFSSLVRLGLKAGPSFALAGAFAMALLAVDYLHQRNQIIITYTQTIQDTVERMKKISDEMVNIEGCLLRMNELLRSLYQCNKVYIQAYVKIRNNVFPEPTFWNFIKGVNKKSDYFNGEEMKRDIMYLIQVCCEYNKINFAGITDRKN